MGNIFEGKKILVTGGAGSIGSQIVRGLLKFEPKQIRVYDSDEKELFFIEQEFSETKKIRPLVGDVRDKERLNRAMHNIDFVFHAAALKHVPLCEYNPFEAIKTNVGGTQNVIETALDNNAEKVVNISTDKAVNPVNTMGATKLLAEKLVTSANLYAGDKRTTFSSVRFGNVLGSNGSILDLFRWQMKNKKKITVTHPEMTRFVMSIHAATKLIAEATTLMQGGEIFILKMPAVKLHDLVDVAVNKISDGKEVEIKEIGVRAGEKMHESLMTEEEFERARETEKMYVIPPEAKMGIEFEEEKAGKKISSIKEEYGSDRARLLSKKEIGELLDEAG